MSGFHWSDDPILARSAENCGRLRRDAEYLGFTLRYTSSRDSDAFAICNACQCVVWIGDDSSYTRDNTSMGAHNEWHDRRG